MALYSIDKSKSFFIDGGEENGSIFKINTRELLAQLLFSQPGQKYFLKHVRDTFPHARFPPNRDSGYPENILFVPKINLQAVSTEWNEITFKDIQDQYSFPWPLIAKGSSIPEGCEFALQFFKTDSAFVVDLSEIPTANEGELQNHYFDSL